VRDRRNQGTWIGWFGRTIAAAVVLVAVAEAQAEITRPAVHLKRTAKSGHETLIDGHIRWDNNCEPLRPIILHLDHPPSHGIVCAKVEQTTIKTVYKGTATHCIGRTIPGVRIVYLSKPDYVGPDEFKYTYERLGLKRTISINVVRADKSSRGAIPGDLAANEKQEPGAIPACSGLVS
jgi:hypothetical protein